MATEQPGDPTPQPPRPPSQPDEVPQPPSQPDEMPQLPDQPHPPGNPPTMRADGEREPGDKAAAPESDERSHGEQYPGPAEETPTGDQYDVDPARPEEPPSPKR